MNSLYGSFRQNKFSDIFSDATTFLTDYNSSGAKVVSNTINAKYALTDTQVYSVYYMLYAYYGNSVVASSDTNRFKENLFSIMVQYGPTSFKQLEIQDKLRALTEEEILNGSSSITNMALNPNDIDTDTDRELNYISNQQTNKFKKGLISGYQDILLSLQSDYMRIFIERFRPLFLTVIQPEEPLLYESED